MERNAKEYNETASAVYQDAERIRKATLNWMQKMNPAHKKPGYSVIPTPIPEPEKRLTLSLKNNTTRNSVPAEPEREKTKDMTPKVVPAETKPGSGAAQASQTNGPEDEKMPFKGKDFQQAQERIIADCLEYTDEG